MLAVLIPLLICCGATLALDPRPKPSPQLAPDEVVRIQLRALQENSEARGDGGIALVFEFASPANRRTTGPLERFVEVVKAPDYRPMLNHRTARQGPLQITGNEARQRVTITDSGGETVSYLFLLSKQASEPYENCWMTDAVVREPEVESTGKPV